jgi:hypothetical protein
MRTITVVREAIGIGHRLRKLVPQFARDAAEVARHAAADADFVGGLVRGLIVVTVRVTVVVSVAIISARTAILIPVVVAIAAGVLVAGPGVIVAGAGTGIIVSLGRRDLLPKRLKPGLEPVALGRGETAGGVAALELLDLAQLFAQRRRLRPRDRARLEAGLDPGLEISEAVLKIRLRSRLGDGRRDRCEAGCTRQHHHQITHMHMLLHILRAGGISA